MFSCISNNQLILSEKYIHSHIGAQLWSKHSTILTLTMSATHILIIQFKINVNKTHDHNIKCSKKNPKKLKIHTHIFSERF